MTGGDVAAAVRQTKAMAILNVLARVIAPVHIILRAGVTNVFWTVRDLVEMIEW